MRQFFEMAIDNIINYGDTDIFPFPIENHIFFDCKNEILDLLEKIYKNFDDYLTKIPPINEQALQGVGYTGLRSVCQIDPIWNAYFLGIVLSIADQIENDRISINENKIFSYRFKYNNDEKNLFNKDIGWSSFQKHSLLEINNYDYILICDISDFYSRIYHHRLENALNWAKCDRNIANQIMKMLGIFSKTKSYGLPIGGNASRILAELVLNSTDKLLKNQNICFCRFVDDFHLFANSKLELYENFIYLSKTLLENEGLTLQKNKTRIMLSKEFKASSPFIIEKDEIQNKIYPKSKLLSLSLKYDPYSQTAIEDYQNLKTEVEKIDILEILKEELNKSRIHTPTFKKLIGSVKFLPISIQEQVIESLYNNISLLYPVFPNIMILTLSIFDSLTEKTQNNIINKLITLINNDPYINNIDVNLSYAVRVLAKSNNDKTNHLLNFIFQNTRSNIIKKEVIFIMANWRNHWWLSDLKTKYMFLNTWEKRAFIIAHYILDDEGEHWRNSIKNSFNDFEQLYREWACKKKQKDYENWKIPL